MQLYMHVNVPIPFQSIWIDDNNPDLSYTYIHYSNHGRPGSTNNESVVNFITL